MQEVKNSLLTLRNSLEVEKFDINDYLMELQEIDELSNDRYYYENFCYILEVDEIGMYDFEDEIVSFANTIKDSKYVDIQILQAMNYIDIIDRLDTIIEEI